MVAKTTIQRGSGNVFADLGLPDADLRLAKAELACAIERLITNQRLTKPAAAKIMGLAPAEVSDIVRGRLARFTIDRLEDCLIRMGTR